MREPEGGFSSRGLAEMFDGLVGDNDKKSNGAPENTVKNLMVAILAFWAGSFVFCSY
jgi:hypothetical protein